MFLLGFDTWKARNTKSPTSCTVCVPAPLMKKESCAASEARCSHKGRKCCADRALAVEPGVGGGLQNQRVWRLGHGA